jgi:hypothetical protein
VSQTVKRLARGTYFSLGVEHILLGYNHLLFVLGLVLVTATVRFEIASRLRSNPRISFRKIATTLGFSEASAFTRAFRR